MSYYVVISSNFCLLQERCYLPSHLPRLTLLKASNSTRHLIIHSVLPRLYSSRGRTISLLGSALPLVSYGHLSYLKRARNSYRPKL